MTHLINPPDASSSNDNLVLTVTTIINLGFLYSSSPEYVSQFVDSDSVLYPNGYDKTICRLGCCIRELSNSKAQAFTPDDLVDLVCYFDQFTIRDYLYEKRLKQDSSLIMGTEISVNAPWEDILRPIQAFKANWSYLHNYSGIKMGLALFLMYATLSKIPEASSIDLSAIFIVFDNRVLPNQVPAQFVHSVGEIASSAGKTILFQRTKATAAIECEVVDESTEGAEDV